MGQKGQEDWKEELLARIKETAEFIESHYEGVSIDTANDAINSMGRDGEVITPEAAFTCLSSNMARISDCDCSVCVGTHWMNLLIISKFAFVIRKHLTDLDATAADREGYLFRELCTIYATVPNLILISIKEVMKNSDHIHDVGNITKDDLTAIVNAVKCQANNRN